MASINGFLNGSKIIVNNAQTHQGQEKSFSQFCPWCENCEKRYTNLTENLLVGRKTLLTMQSIIFFQEKKN